MRIAVKLMTVAYVYDMIDALKLVPFDAQL